MRLAEKNRSKSLITLKYAHNAGHFADRRWCAVIDETGHAYDYGRLKDLEADLKEEGLDYRIETQHRNGTVSYRSPK